MTGARRAFRSEWIKLRRRRLLFGTLGGVVAVEVLITMLTFATAGVRTGRDGPNGPGGSVTLAHLATSSGMTYALGQSVTLLGVVAVCVAAAQLATEYTNGTLRNLLVRQPNRLVLLAGKYLGVASFVALGVVAAAVTSVGVSFLMAGTKGISTSQWLSAGGMASGLRTFANVELAITGYTTIGVFLAVLFRSPIIAIAVGIAYLLPVENIVAGAVTQSARFLPGQLLSAIAEGGTSSVGYLWALAGSLLLCLAMAGLGAGLFQRRDVTS